MTLRAFLTPVARHFRGRGWHVDAAANGAGQHAGLEGAYDALHHLPLSRNPLDPRNPTVGFLALRRLLEQGRYDVVHVMTPIAGFLARLAARSLPAARRPRVVYVAHGFHFWSGAPPLRNAVYRTLEGLAAPWTDYFGVINGEDWEAAHQAGWGGEGLFVQPGPGVDPERFASPPEPQGVRQEWGIAPDHPVFVCVAEFTPRKRHADLIRAFAAADLPDAHLLLAGTGPLREESARLAAELGVGDRVRFLGFRRDVPALMAAANAVVLASEQEGSPTCVIEALMLGAAVVGTDIRGTRDVLAGTGNVLVPLGDSQALARALKATASEPPAAIRPRSYPGVERYSLRNVLRVHEEVYGAALAGRPVPDPLRRFPLSSVSHG